MYNNLIDIISFYTNIALLSTVNYKFNNHEKATIYSYRVFIDELFLNTACK